MKREIIVTKDGSHTVAIPEMNVTYHSHHGAIQESMHVFIETGLVYLLSQPEQQKTQLRIFEMGFGTGLNAFLTAIEGEKRKAHIYYTAVEKYPLSVVEANSLNYQLVLGQQDLFERLHHCPWGVDHTINKYFTLRKEQTDILSFTAQESFHLVYFDAFAPSAQPELWTEDVFRKLFDIMVEGGVLVTYCSKGSVRRAMQAAGFVVTKLAGPPGKREIVRAVKTPQRH
ncbi:tRNA (5-methylaminomethyl-2-thiouridine)(34)-methyltransferase MnmD [Chitinophagaceae bacterium LB-8]|uniref:tRNA (5-methylaminomethyl-2-thiouridine)(34)-methyltransferase MnmD n=1 Tax=Paraflavisolibacter caeni TaxID=2982496 RepID=A0A9X2XT67_9BACT|nr:tRNA (5-methylaminomethyl-2-thiouridine)(34)-methyltransferase MnmD [Paraflavisolibacter caeni]MCU7548516.1 tRNA (5-methylaminomethyl-2-thiouridine)(34)-methyltransferase MnmD [Paraflavisolibacter caeni]